MLTFDELTSCEITDVFEYYDFPLVFISKSPSDKYYLNYYIEKLKDGSDKWLFCEISTIERKRILDGELPLLAILKQLKESKRLQYLTIILSGETFKTVYESVNELNFDEDSFPEDDFYVV